MKFRYLAVVGLSVVIALLAGAASVGPARADAPRTMVCMPAPEFKNGTAANIAARLELQHAWANEQLAAGRTDFMVMPLLNLSLSVQPVAFCAW